MIWLAKTGSGQTPPKKRLNDQIDFFLHACRTQDWSHITDQIGMFAFSGLTKDQVRKKRS